ncbi:hypothetical protein L226DRAFT_91279 [Lentinus tigrinus ALCF2SS1-7]|uniref:Uncharacterized protein n=1 Tax=Lentinus tigrinus ALCF2SS1-6 TaxID=1328759 RepID=A0A5C2RYN1_9APHY|nr:hypothetical protein L227DRAFT_288653 [Lentinus tigrinus ALCF2SS1-6]RPD73945.1 hypothetical protein L226DRAFT_91279 [Lentinus tigrinus ALCF2SS1-7]
MALRARRSPAPARSSKLEARATTRRALWMLRCSGCRGRMLGSRRPERPSVVRRTASCAGFSSVYPSAARSAGAQGFALYVLRAEVRSRVVTRPTSQLGRGGCMRVLHGVDSGR